MMCWGLLILIIPVLSSSSICSFSQPGPGSRGLSHEGVSGRSCQTSSGSCVGTLDNAKDATLRMGKYGGLFYVTGFLFLLPRLIIYYHELG